MTEEIDVELKKDNLYYLSINGHDFGRSQKLSEIVGKIEKYLKMRYDIEEQKGFFNKFMKGND